MIGLAIDPATATGAAWGSELRELKVTHFKIPKREALGERLVFLSDRIEELIVRASPDIMLTEEPFMPFQGTGKPEADEEGRTKFKFSPQTMDFLRYVKAIIHEKAARHGVPLEAYASSSWRVTALGYGRAAGVDLKAAMMAKARTLGYSCETEDEADAIGIWMHGMLGPTAAARKQSSLLDVFGKRL